MLILFWEVELLERWWFLRFLGDSIEARRHRQHQFSSVDRWIRRPLGRNRWISAFPIKLNEHDKLTDIRYFNYLFGNGSLLHHVLQEAEEVVHLVGYQQTFRYEMFHPRQHDWSWKKWNNIQIGSLTFKKSCYTNRVNRWAGICTHPDWRWPELFSRRYCLQPTSWLSFQRHIWRSRPWLAIQTDCITTQLYCIDLITTLIWRLLSYALASNWFCDRTMSANWWEKTSAHSLINVDIWMIVKRQMCNYVEFISIFLLKFFFFSTGIRTQYLAITSQRR